MPIETSAKYLVLEVSNVRDGENILPDVLTVCTAPADGAKAFACSLRFEGLVSARPIELTFDLAATAYDRCSDEKCSPPKGAHPRIGTAVIAY